MIDVVVAPRWWLRVVVPFLVMTLSGCFDFDVEQIDISEYPDVPDLAGRCVELQQSMFLVKNLEHHLEAESVNRYVLMRPGESLTPFTVSEYRSGDYEPDSLSEVLRIVEAGTQIRLDRLWDLEHFEGSIAALTAEMQHARKVLTVDVIRILDDMWILALDEGVIRPHEREEIGDRPVLDPRCARFCEESSAQVSESGSEERGE